MSSTHAGEDVLPQDSVWEESCSTHGCGNVINFAWQNIVLVGSFGGVSDYH